MQFSMVIRQLNTNYFIFYIFLRTDDERRHDEGKNPTKKYRKKKSNVLLRNSSKHSLNVYSGTYYVEKNTTMTSGEEEKKTKNIEKPYTVSFMFTMTRYYAATFLNRLLHFLKHSSKTF